MDTQQSHKIKILHLEDLPSDAELVERELKKSDIAYEKIVVDNQLAFENALTGFMPDIILSDHSLPSFDSIQALKILKARYIQIPFILITSTMTDELAVNIMQEGADDYIIKDRLHRLSTAIKNVLEKYQEKKEKQKILDQIAANERRFRTIIEKSTDIKMLSTLDGRFIYGSPAVTTTFGYSYDEFINQKATDFFHPDEIKEFLKKREEISKVPGGSFSFQYRLLHKNGNWVWCEGTLTNFIHDPSIQAFVSNFRDISERKKAEKALKKSEAFNRGILDSLHSHIAVVDQYGKIIAVNESWNKFAIENGDSSLISSGIGINYFDVCNKAIKANEEMAYDALQGMKEVLNGNQRDFYMEYPCHAKYEKRWFGMRVVKFNDEEPMIVVTHVNISERKKAEEEILEKNIQLQSLLQIAQTIREAERKTVAREIHDELGQQLTALKMDIDWIQHKQVNPSQIVADKLKDMLAMSDKIINTVRRISSDLRPAIIDDLGMIATIEWKVADFEEKTGIKCEFISSVKERQYSKEYSINLYRILQESFTNIVRHANATFVRVIFSETEDDIILEIKDDGKGISEEKIKNSNRLGILGMKERASMLGGELIISRNTDAGTCVKLILAKEDEYTNS